MALTVVVGFWYNGSYYPIGAVIGGNEQTTVASLYPAFVTGAPTAINAVTSSAIGGTITTANHYQQIAAAGQAVKGGFVENTGTSNFQIDWTAGVTAGQTTLSGGSTTVEAGSGTAGGKQSIPSTPNAVFVFGPAGSTWTGATY